MVLMMVLLGGDTAAAIALLYLWLLLLGGHWSWTCVMVMVGDGDGRMLTDADALCVFATGFGNWFLLCVLRLLVPRRGPGFLRMERLLRCAIELAGRLAPLVKGTGLGLLQLLGGAALLLQGIGR